MDQVVAVKKVIQSDVNIETGNRSTSRFLSVLYWAFFIVFIFTGAAFRFTNLNIKYVWFDESLTLFYASGYNFIDAYSELESKNGLKITNLQKYQAPSESKTTGDVLKTLMVYDSATNPLYYLLVRVWMETFGSTVAVARSMSAVFDVMSLLAVFWLCLELFQNKIVALVSAALLSVSPIFIIYAQEARNYSLWCLAILLSSAAFLRAVRKDTTFDWALFFITCLIGIYTNLLFTFSLVIYTFYILDVEKFQLTRKVHKFFITCISLIFAFSPWLWVLANSILVHKENLAWTAQLVVSFQDLVRGWIHNYTTLFWDIGFTENKILNYPVRIVVLAVEMLSVVYFLKKSTTKTWLFILPMIILPWVVLAIPDIFFGGSRTYTARYLFLSYIGVLITVSYLVYKCISSRIRWAKVLGSLLLVFIYVSGLISYSYYAPANTWWNKDGNKDWLRVSLIINQSDNPLLFISRKQGSGLGDFFSLSHVLDPKVTVLFNANPESLISQTQYSNIYWLDALNIEIEKLKSSSSIKVINIVPFLLWQLNR